VVRIVPDVPHYQRDLANCLNGLGRVYVRENQKEKADAAFRSAFEHWEKLIKNHGAERDYNLGLYQSCLSLGNLLVTGTNPADALTWYQRALKVAPEADKAAIKKIVDKLSAT
jgi:tetratricopeptide (TPR) repeat protein